MGFKRKKCDHLAPISKVKIAENYECANCIKTGDSWVHLRTCQECGITLCCDSSPNQHARKHCLKYDHNVISSAEPRERWLYCYVDKIMIPY